MQGQATSFFRYFPEKIASVISRYQNETKRLFAVLDRQLEGREWIVDDTPSPTSQLGWVRAYAWAGLDIDDLPNLKRWNEAMAAGPACQRGVEVPMRIDPAAIAPGGRRSSSRASQTLIWLFLPTPTALVYPGRMHYSDL
jgi:glutathione S-transferase